MNNSWPTREQDMHAAKQIIEEYANSNECDTLGLFEIVVNKEEKCMNFKLSRWVLTLAEYFKTQYGANQGDFVTRKVISRCLTEGNTVH
ncbi:hypothetical protein ACFORL_06425 [Legionella dresdenensis]|uniref:Ankyrin repeat protein n=1 Tax=Legionella dresdenensis TaxID=450200 RepID=A0ABV8CEX0_9GAMM